MADNLNTLFLPEVKPLSRRQVMIGAAAALSMMTGAALANTAVIADPDFAIKCERFYQAKAALDRHYKRSNALIDKILGKCRKGFTTEPWRSRIDRIEQSDSDILDMQTEAQEAAVMHAVYTPAEVAEKIRLTQLDGTFECAGEKVDARRDAIFKDVVAFASRQTAYV